jgi:hypothetical protein
MSGEDRLQELEEIKRLERDVHLRRSRLASRQALDEIAVAPYGTDIRLWEALMERIGERSCGGDAVADGRDQRAR